MITPAQVSAIQASLKELQLDGWLLYDFRAVNPVTGRVLGVGGMGSRRLFVLIPREGQATAVAHKIELQPVSGFPGQVRPYAKWEELHQELGSLVRGKRLAMEVSPEDAVPYLDRVPAGVVELIRKLGGTVVPSAPLVSRFAASWSSNGDGRSFICGGSAGRGGPGRTPLGGRSRTGDSGDRAAGEGG